MSNFNVVTSTSSESFSSNSNTRIVALPKTLKDSAKILIKTLEEIDKFKRISHLFIINDNNIKINTSNLGGNFLGFVFARAHAKNYNTEGKAKTRKRTSSTLNIFFPILFRFLFKTKKEYNYFTKSQEILPFKETLFI